MSQGHTPDPILESQQLSPHRPGPLWESRDYSLTLACQSTACYLNTQAGECAAPSCVRLDANGRCIPFQQSQPPKEESR
jgi:hypothetical protein